MYLIPPDKWQAQCPSAEVCEGEGYLGRDCTCVCPPGREGDRCEVQKAEYYRACILSISLFVFRMLPFIDGRVNIYL